MMNEHSDLRTMRGRAVLVTGAGSGMGRATAEVFAADGAHVALTDLPGSPIDEIAAELRAKGYSAEAWALDVTDAEAIRQVTEEVAARFGRLDALVNNAGISAFCPIDDDAYDLIWDRAVAVLLTAHQRLIRAALPHLRRSDAGRIVNIASIEALGATNRDSPYCAAKAGVTGLTRALAVELGKDEITVNCICPGPILTGMTDSIPEADRQTYAHRRTALRRYGRPEEVAHMTLSLCLPASSYLTGAVIPVDGGQMARNA
ncbi:MAG TPA: SDR family NAD(P)-dependent oxidoreductase [Novosphingobium sp.]|jgi:3-oxoacyl-[acyl-carrier protein] reductase|nr:SDR family NAD(P)-dependent oxidoreductase [Novosphingobium sp.]HPB23528.1 SDR family NAD(P)-dependent oxidoreductase [Novosphingobium sp.]HQN52871.1 SDR family NAD(P)-dependent oxidoreductase [Novosphingobium sp.]